MSEGETTLAPVMTPGHVVRAYLAISALFTLSASAIWGVNTLFLLDSGLDIFECSALGSASTPVRSRPGWSTRSGRRATRGN